MTTRLRHCFYWFLPLVVILNYVVGMAWFEPHSRSIDLDRSAIRLSTGYSYSVALPEQPFWALSAIRTDNERSTNASAMLLLEDGQMIGKPGASFQQLSTIGNGHFHLWDDRLYFSTSDRSDPTINGRRYTMVVTPSVRPIILIGIALIDLFFILLLADAIRSRRMMIPLLVFVALLHGLLLITAIDPPTRTISVDPARVLSHEGFAYRFPLTPASILSPYRIETDTPKHNNASRIVLMEGEQPFGTSRATFHQVSATGLGNYHLWNRSLYFSTPDNSDPRTNQRSYTIKAQQHVARWIYQGLLLIDILLLLVIASRPRQPDVTRGQRLLIIIPVVMIMLLYTLLWMQTPAYFIIHSDSWGFLAPALSVLSDGPFTQVGGRSFIYPGFVYAIWALFKQPTAIIYAQWLLFLSTAVLLALSCRAVIAPLTTRLMRVLLLMVVLLLCGFYLSYFPPRLFVHWLMPETLYIFLMALSLLLLLKFWSGNSDYRTSMLLFVLAFFVTAANAYVKPHWIGAALFTIALLIYRLWTLKQIPRRHRVLLLLTTTLVVYSTLVLPQKMLSKKYDFFDATVFGPMVLFCNHSDLITPLLGQSESTLPPEKIARVRESLQAHLNAPKMGWGLLGFRGDYCVFEDEPNNTIRGHFHYDAEAIKAFYMHHFLSAIRHDPLGYISKVLHQYRALINNPAIYRGSPLRFDNNEITARQEFDPTVQRLMPFELQLHGTINPLALNIMPQYQLHMLLKKAAVTLWCLLLFTLLVDGLRTRLNSDFRRRVSPVLIINMLYFASAAVVAAAHTFDVDRYSQVMIELFLLTLFVNGYYPIRYWSARLTTKPGGCRRTD